MRADVCHRSRTPPASVTTILSLCKALSSPALPCLNAHVHFPLEISINELEISIDAFWCRVAGRTLDRELSWGISRHTPRRFTSRRRGLTGIS
ncbi:hypothetical protein BD311DRAFT_133426 [Dichomitus squalens]|uniref:Uncharacterized protein n=1 Tax=Dichomitus squalens TaxID=114155 RepID=A0A4Q9MTM3_9APHY|nr:hypothetical protein BD311DRAFT_133426 [Dichomitus squalens]